MMAGCVYRGVVTHKRWRPTGHGFAYELFMLLVDVDRLDALFATDQRRWWPIAAVNSRLALVSICEDDHMKLSRKPGQRLGDAVRDAVEAATGWRPADGCRIHMLTMPAIAGYAFNPVSFYYVWAEDGSAVDTVIAEVTNTPWNEMHYYICRKGAPGVTAMPAWERAAKGGAGAEKSNDSNSGNHDEPLSKAAEPMCVETPLDAKLLASAGAVHPTDFEGLAGRFEGKEEGPAANSAYSEGRRLRFKFAKSFHVSPFMSLHDQEYDWIFTEPGFELGSPGGTLLVQNQNIRRVKQGEEERGERMFNSQLRLVKQELTPLGLCYLVFIAFPLLTLRVQWWIHVEAVKLWWKGVELYAHPTGASNAFVRTVELLFTPLVWVTAIVSRLSGLLSKDSKRTLKC